MSVDYNAKRLLERQEGALAAFRIGELDDSPVQGKYDAAHLKEIHRRIFQDLPSHRPGEFREPAPGHYKSRALETSSSTYLVKYENEKNIKPQLDKVLATANGPEAFKGLNTNQFAERMAKLYSDLDYIHPFKEGNSRTLRVFTTQIARDAGYEIKWADSNTNAVTRDKLYAARDKEVLERAYPGLDAEKAGITNDRDEYEAFYVLQSLKRQDDLKTLIRGMAQNKECAEKAEAFLYDTPEEAVKKHPDLVNAFAMTKAAEVFAERRFHGDHVARDSYIEKTRQTLAGYILREKELPEIKIRSDPQTTKESGREIER